MNAQQLQEVFEKLASYGETPKAPEATAEDNCSIALERLFENHEGIAQRAKHEELRKHFPLDNPAYSTRKQELIDKIAQVINYDPSK